MECKEAKNLLSNYIENDLSEFQRVKIEEHLLTCKSCRAELEGLKKMIMDLRDMKKAAAPKDLLEGVHRRLGMPPPERPLFNRIRVPLEAVGVLASILLIVYFVNQSGMLIAPKQVESGGVMQKRAVPASVGNALYVPAETFEATPVVTEKGEYKVGAIQDSQEESIYIKVLSEIENAVKEFGGEVEKTELNKVYVKMPTENLEAFSGKLNTITKYQLSVTGQEDDTSNLSIEFQAETRY